MGRRRTPTILASSALLSVMVVAPAAALGLVEETLSETEQVLDEVDDEVIEPIESGLDDTVDDPVEEVTDPVEEATAPVEEATEPVEEATEVVDDTPLQDPVEDTDTVEATVEKLLTPSPSPDPVPRTPVIPGPSDDAADTDQGPTRRAAAGPADEPLDATSPDEGRSMPLPVPVGTPTAPSEAVAPPAEPAARAATAVDVPRGTTATTTAARAPGVPAVQGPPTPEEPSPFLTLVAVASGLAIGFWATGRMFGRSASGGPADAAARPGPPS